MKNPHILLVEDNPDDIALTMRALRNNDIKAKVIVVQDGVEALNYLFGKNNGRASAPGPLPQLVVMDLKLPKIDGLEVLSRLRSDERTRHIPVVVLTTSNERTDIAACYRLGANSYIRKPVDFSRFNEVMRQIGQYWLQLNEFMPNGNIV